jgi:hypothetical protein
MSFWTIAFVCSVGIIGMCLLSPPKHQGNTYEYLSGDTYSYDGDR